MHNAPIQLNLVETKLNLCLQGMSLIVSVVLAHSKYVSRPCSTAIYSLASQTSSATRKIEIYPDLEVRVS